MVDWELEPTDPDKVKVRFSPLQCTKCENELSDSEVSFEIVWASEEVLLNELGKCEDYVYDKYLQSDRNIFGKSSNISKTLIENKL